MRECGLSINTFTISFFGHRITENPLLIEKRLESIIRYLLQEKEYVVFQVCRDGEFDQTVSSTICRCKRTIRDDNSAHVWVLPYETAAYRENEEAFLNYYDEITICEASAKVHYKRAYQIRNQEMVKKSDLVIFYVQHESGGAWQTMRYTRRLGTPYLNIGSEKY